jgi:sugar transferase (PEP-CTERM system associated)
LFSLKKWNGVLSLLVGDLSIAFAIFSLYAVLCGSFADHLNDIFFFCCLIVLSCAVNRFYAFIESYHLFELFLRVWDGFLLSLLLILAYYLLLHQGKVDPFFIVPTLITFCCLFCFRFWVFFCIEGNREQLIILGANSLSRKLIREVNKRPFRNFTLSAVFSSQEKDNMDSFEGIPVNFTFDNLEDYVWKQEIDCIIIALRDRRGKIPSNELLRLKTRNVSILEGFNFYEQLTRTIIVDDFLKPSWFIYEKGFKSSAFLSSLKRVQGVLLSLLLLILLAPVYLMIAILIKLESSGPVLFRQKRVGMQGKIFTLYKFRSMKQEHNKERMQTVFTSKNDPRLTRVGKIIRKIRLDEIPQLINILKGDMNMVGPRPEQPEFVEKLRFLIPYYDLRHTIRPGLTGWAQVRYQYGESFEDSHQKLHYDLYYVKHRSWFLDFQIVMLTFWSVLLCRGQ